MLACGQAPNDALLNVRIPPKREGLLNASLPQKSDCIHPLVAVLSIFEIVCEPLVKFFSPVDDINTRNNGLLTSKNVSLLLVLSFFSNKT